MIPQNKDGFDNRENVNALSIAISIFTEERGGQEYGYCIGEFSSKIKSRCICMQFGLGEETCGVFLKI